MNPMAMGNAPKSRLLPQKCPPTGLGVGLLVKKNERPGLSNWSVGNVLMHKFLINEQIRLMFG